jgi:hypothetical protein
VPGVLSADAADAADLFHPCRVSCSGFSWTFYVTPSRGSSRAGAAETGLTAAA